MISLCVPSYNRFEMVLQCFEKIHKDRRIDEIIISDDCSTDGSYEHLSNHFKYDSKVKIHRNESNFDCYFNKRKAVELASNNWVILGDSDNVFGLDYLDRIFDYTWDKDYILTPDFAYPKFDFRAYSGLTVNRKNVAEYIDKPLFETMLNASNFFINKKTYLEVWDGSIDPVTSDSIYFTSKWLEGGKSIFVVPDLCYFHRVHPQSHYQNNVARTPIGFHEQILQKLRELK